MRFLIGLLALIFLGSCASVNNSIMKRRYNKGYFVDIRSKKHAKTTEVHVPVKVALTEKGAVVVASTAYVGRTLFEKRLSRTIFAPERKSAVVAKSRRFVSHTNDLDIANGFSSNTKHIFKKGLRVPAGAPPSDPIIFLIFWLICSLLYTLCILAEQPSINFFVALGLGILAGLFTALTGQVISC